MSNPRVSIIMPVFNAAETVGCAMASVQAQTEADFELLVIDDGSTDATADIVRAAAETDGRIRLVRIEQNGGPAAARNLGFLEAQGEFLALLDADDRYEPRRLRHLLALAWAQRADMVSDNVLLCPLDPAEKPGPMIPPALLPRPQNLSAAEFVERNIGSRRYPRVSFGFMKPLFRRAFIEAHGLRYDERNRFGEDYLLYLDCLVRGALWWITPEPLYLYSVRPGSLTEVQTSGDLGRIRAAEQVLLRDARIAGDPGLRRALRRHKAGIDRRYHYRAFTDAVKEGRLRAALARLLASPESLRCIAQECLSQAPVIAAKAWRGGYRRRGSVTV